MISIRHWLCALLVCAASVYACGAEMAVLRNGFEIRHERREVIGDSVRLYLGATADAGYVDVPADEIVGYEPDNRPPRDAMATAAPEGKAGQAGSSGSQRISALEVERLISEAAERHHIDRDLIASVIHAESNFNPRAVSPKGARGLMQLMPGTAAQLGVTDSFQAEANIDGGVRYLRELLVRYNDDVVKALAAYNAGPDRVQRYGGVPPYRETHAYVARVVRDFNSKKQQPKRVHGNPPKTRSARSQVQNSRASGVLAAKKSPALPRSDNDVSTATRAGN